MSNLNPAVGGRARRRRPTRPARWNGPPPAPRASTGDFGDRRPYRLGRRGPRRPQILRRPGGARRHRPGRHRGDRLRLAGPQRDIRGAPPQLALTACQHLTAPLSRGPASADRPWPALATRPVLQSRGKCLRSTWPTKQPPGWRSNPPAATTTVLCRNPGRQHLAVGSSRHSVARMAPPRRTVLSPAQVVPASGSSQTLQVTPGLMPPPWPVFGQGSLSGAAGEGVCRTSPSRCGGERCAVQPVP